MGKMSELQVGLGLNKHWMVYVTEGGRLRWAPTFVMKIVCTLWNVVSCALYGHDELVQTFEAGPVECVSCCRPIRRPDMKTVTQVWRIK